MVNNELPSVTDPAGDPERNGSREAPDAVDAIPAVSLEGGERVDGDVVAEFRRRSRRAFLSFGAGSVAAIGGWWWLNTRGLDGEVRWPLRGALNIDDRVARVVARPSAKVSTVNAATVEFPRVNGVEGMVRFADEATWKIHIVANGKQVGALTMADLRTLPERTESVLHKCIEGWSTPVTWTGPRLRDVLDLARQRTGAPRTKWVGFATPSGGYYVNFDWESTRRPQALMAHSLNARPLSLEHGSPVRLAMPTHYGVKSLKQVGIIAFSDAEPPDYWAERGYDKDMSF